MTRPSSIPQIGATTWCLVATVAALAASWALKARCLDISVLRVQFERLCYNDVQVLYRTRGIAQGRFPYIHGALRNGLPVRGAIEYPVLTGLFMWVVGQVATGVRSYVEVTAALLASATVATTVLLAKLKGLRALIWAAAPALILYAFHNWDVLAVTSVVIGLFSWFRDRRKAAAVAFGLGAAFKLFPLIFLPALFLESLFEGRLKRGVSEVLIGAGTFVVINLPIAAINLRGWWATYQFQAIRPPNHDSLWDLAGRLIGRPDVTQINVASAILIFVSLVGVHAAGWAIARRSGRFPYLEVCAATLAILLLWSKVQSPQYTLWLLPFFVLLDVSLFWWILYSVADVLVYFGVFRFYYDYSRLASGAFHLGVWLRSGLLLALAPVFLLSTSTPIKRKAKDLHPVPSHPATSV